MASEIEAAAERILMQGAEQEEHYWSTGRSFEADAVLVARDYVDRLAADRAEREERERLIDAEWLESIGGSSCRVWRIDLGNVDEMFLDATSRVEVTLVAVDGVWKVDACFDEMTCLDFGTMRTRGELLRLLDMLRVLKGGAE